MKIAVILCSRWTDGRDNVSITHRGADLFDLSFAKVAEIPRRRAAGDVEEEVADDRSPGFAVRHFRMELDPVATPLGVLECGDRCIRG